MIAVVQHVRAVQFQSRKRNILADTNLNQVRHRIGKSFASPSIVAGDRLVAHVGALRRTATVVRKRVCIDQAPQMPRLRGPLLDLKDLLR